MLAIDASRDECPQSSNLRQKHSVLSRFLLVKLHSFHQNAIRPHGLDFGKKKKARKRKSVKKRKVSALLEPHPTHPVQLRPLSLAPTHSQITMPTTGSDHARKTRCPYCRCHDAALCSCLGGLGKDPSSKSLTIQIPSHLS